MSVVGEPVRELQQPTLLGVDLGLFSFAQLPITPAHFLTLVLSPFYQFCGHLNISPIICSLLISARIGFHSLQQRTIAHL